MPFWGNWKHARKKLSTRSSFLLILMLSKFKRTDIVNSPSLITYFTKKIKIKSLFSFSITQLHSELLQREQFYKITNAPSEINSILVLATFQRQAIIQDLWIRLVDSSIPIHFSVFQNTHQHPQEPRSMLPPGSEKRIHVSLSICRKHRRGKKNINSHGRENKNISW